MLAPQHVAWIATAAILFPLSAMAVGLRVLATYKRGASMKLHDYLVFLSFLALIGYVSDVSVGVVHGGYGIHATDLPLETLFTGLKTFWISEWFWATGVASFRLAILLLYIEIFQTRSFRLIAKGTALIVILYWVACIITISVLCLPVEFNWDRSLNGTCGNVFAIEVFSGAFNMVLDIWVVFLPLPTIWKLQLAPQKKLAVSASFALGLGTAGVNLGRLIQTIQCPVEDISFCVLNSSILVTAEITGGLLVACVPTYGVLLFRNAKGNSSTPQKDSGGIIRTIGQISLRPRKKGSMTLDDSLMSQNDLQWRDEEFVNSLAMTPNDMGHQTEIDTTEAKVQSAKYWNLGTHEREGITRKVEYHVRDS
ncbi:hypothetical protein F4808DRAFT_409268 [Astrocystis sublimbata]|nr:hypothetical protein F4808DRAFT_409268 [Astrocystis sublimbata]